MNLYEHLIHFAWPLVVATFHRYVLDKLLAPIGRAIVSLFKPDRLAEKLIEEVESKLESKIESHHQAK